MNVITFSSLVFITSILYFSSNCHAFFNNKKSLVRDIDASSFDREVIKNEVKTRSGIKITIVKFYAPYCGYCKKMVPAYEKLAENLKDLVDVLAIDCTIDRNQAICSRYKVEGYPTVKIFVINGKDEGKKKKIVLDYNGERSTADMTKFLKTHGHQFIFKVSEKIKVSKTNLSKWNVDFDSFFAKGGALPKLLLFRSKTNEAPTLLFRALSIKFHYKIVVGEVSTVADAELAKNFNLAAAKVSLVYFPNGRKEKFIVYNEEITRKAIFGFLNNQLASATSTDKSEL